MRWTLSAMVLGASIAACPGVRAQGPGFHLGQAATACANARATAALGGSDPRRADPSWVAFVVNDGHCTHIEAEASVSVIEQTGALSQIEYPPGSGQRLFIASAAILPDAVLPSASPLTPVPPATGEAPPLNAWSTAGAGTGQDAACSLSGPAGPGTLAMSVSADRPGAVRLILSKPSWRLQPRVPTRLLITFPGMPGLNLAGTGGGTSLEFVLGAQVKAVLHGFTAASSGSLSFPGATEAPWQLDLAGTSAAVSAMAECVSASGTILAPPPFGLAQSVPRTSPALDIELPPIRP